jgi:hypothetical protein
MSAETDATKSEGRKVVYKGAGSDAVYGLGLIGALVYYISTAASFWAGLLGVGKAIFWPAFVVYELLKYLGM